MKRLVFFVFIFILLFFTYPAVGQSSPVEQDEIQVIPDDAIRLRILANSDDDADQKLKEQVRDDVNEQITTWVEHITDIDEARQLIQDNIPSIDQTIQETLADANEAKEYSVEYDKNVTFPTKLYGNFLYPAGEYEAILITLGEGKGSNWWCVLFPPLCFLDFGSGTSVEDSEEASQTAESEEEEEVEVKFFLLDWLGLS